MKNFFKYVIGFIIIVLWMSMSSIIYGLPLMWLWNWIMPMLFGLVKIGYLQAVGIVFMCNILFKGTVRINSND